MNEPGDGTIRERAKRFLVQCPACDAGLPKACKCPSGDPRSMILALVTELEAESAKRERLAKEMYRFAEAMGNPYPLRRLLNALTR